MNDKIIIKKVKQHARSASLNTAHVSHSTQSVNGAKVRTLKSPAREAEVLIICELGSGRPEQPQAKQTNRPARVFRLRFHKQFIQSSLREMEAYFKRHLLTYQLALLMGVKLLIFPPVS
jgi:hypothetical protein